MAWDKLQWDIAYPLVSGGMTWLKDALVVVTGDAVEPCPCFASVNAEGVLSFSFGEGEGVPATASVDVSGGPGVYEGASADGLVSVKAIVGVEPIGGVAGPFELEPCCVMWLTAPPLEAVVAALDEGSLPFVVGEGWSDTLDNGVLTLSSDLPDRSGPTIYTENGVFAVNGLSSQDIPVTGSESAVVSVTQIDGNAVIAVKQKGGG